MLALPFPSSLFVVFFFKEVLFLHVFFNGGRGVCLCMRTKGLICFFPPFVLLQAGRTRAVGIVGIERKLEEKRKETDKNISEVRLFY